MQRDSETNGSDRDFLIYQKGFALSATQALDLEEQLVANPEFISHRLQLIGYFTQNAQSFETLSRWTEHVTWMIQYCPEDWMTGNFSLPLGIEGTPALLVKLSRAWQCTLASFSNNAQVIGRAGQFFASLDFDKSIELLEHAESLDEKSSIWPRSICNQYCSRVSERKSTSDYELAIIHGNQALSREKHRGQKYDLLLRLSYLSLSFNDLPRALLFGRRLERIAEQVDFSYRRYEAQCLLGKIRLKQMKIALANRHLLKAGRHGFHGDLALAKDLLVLQQVEVVVKFFRLCHLHDEQELQKLNARIEHTRHANIDALVLKEALYLLEDRRNQLKIMLAKLRVWTEAIEKGNLLEIEW